MKSFNNSPKFTRSLFNKILAAKIEQEREYIKEHEAIKEILLPLEGKPINGRYLNAKNLGGFSFVQEYGMFYIKGKFDHLIGYSNGQEDTIQVNQINGHRGFIELDACHGRAAAARISQIENSDKEKAFKLFSAIAKNFNALRQLFGEVETQKLGSFNFPAYYDVLNAIYKEKDGEKLRLTDMYYIRK